MGFKCNDFLLRLYFKFFKDKFFVLSTSTLCQTYRFSHQQQFIFLPTPYPLALRCLFSSCSKKNLSVNKEICAFYFAGFCTLNQSKLAKPESFVCDCVVQNKPTLAPIHFPSLPLKVFSTSVKPFPSKL